MPLYEYECSRCGKRFELIQKFSDPPTVTCGGTADRRLSAPSFQFKGSGWYVTDYARKPKSGEPAPAEASAEKGDAKAAGESGQKKDASKPSTPND